MEELGPGTLLRQLDVKSPVNPVTGGDVMKAVFLCLPPRPLSLFHCFIFLGIYFIFLLFLDVFDGVSSSPTTLAISHSLTLLIVLHLP